MVRVSMRERGEFGRVAEAHGVTVAEFLRRYVRAELARLDLDRKAPPQAPR